MSGKGRESRYSPEAEALSLRCLLQLEQLLPVERTAFLLHQVFGQSRSETARIAGVSEATCQQLLLRVQRVMKAARPKIEAERRERQDVTTRFFAGVRSGDVDLLARLLAPEAAAYVNAAGTPAIGRRAVACLLGRLSSDPAVGQVEMSLETREGLVETVRIHLWRSDSESQHGPSAALDPSRSRER